MTDQADTFDFLMSAPDQDRTDFVRFGPHKLPAVMRPDRSKRDAHHRPSGEEKNYLADTHALDQWKLRQVLVGTAENASIVPAVIAANGNKKELNELVSKAMERAGSDDAADHGTALHRVSELVDLGLIELDEIANATIRAQIECYLATLDEHGLKVLPDYVECKRVNDEFQMAGTCDRIYEATKQLSTPYGVVRPGEWVGADLKTNAKGLDYALPGYEVQQAAYTGPHGIPYDVVAEMRGEREPLLRNDIGFVVHLPSTTEDGEPRCEMVALDLMRGFLGLSVAREVRQWRKQAKKVRPENAAVVVVDDPAPSKDPEPVSDAPEATEAPLEELEAWIRERIGQIRGNQAATETLVQAMQFHEIPSLKGRTLTRQDVLDLDALLIPIEAKYEMQFVPQPLGPPTPRPEGSMIPQAPR